MSVENFIFGKRLAKRREIVVSNIEAKHAETTFSMDAEGRFPADCLFQAEGATAEELARATFNRALEPNSIIFVHIDESGNCRAYTATPTLPEAAAQRPDIDTITPVLT